MPQSYFKRRTILVRTKFNSTVAATGLAVLWSILLTSCGGNTSSGIANPTNPDSSTSAVVLRANVSGLPDGASLTLTSDVGESVRIVGPGVVAFTQPVAATATQHVTLRDVPANHTCSPTNGSGYRAGSRQYQVNFVCSDNHNSFWIGGHVHGLHDTWRHSSLVISDNEGAPLRIDHNGHFHFPERVARGGSYRVLVNKQVDNETCSVTDGSGSGILRNVRNIGIHCSEQSFVLGGNVSGLVSGQMVSISDGTNLLPLTVGSNGAFEFPDGVSHHGGYNVTVSNQPTGGICTVTNGQGRDVGANVSNIGVICTPDTYAIGGTVSGLATGEQVTLQNNGSDDLTLNASGTFAFSTPIAYGSAYSVSIISQPLGETCSILDATGSGVTAPVTTVTVTCVPQNPELTVIYTFGTNGGFNDAYWPQSGVVQGSDGNFYGTSANGGNTEVNIVGGNQTTGVVYRITPDGTESLVHTFASGPNVDGIWPVGNLTVGADGNFYGVTEIAGANCLNQYGCGAVFKLSLSGSESLVYSFYNQLNYPSRPETAPVQGSDGNFYGTTVIDGELCTNQTYCGAVYKVTPDGQETTLYKFGTNGGIYDGSWPGSGLIQAADGNFYGVTSYGGLYGEGQGAVQWGNGTIFRITPSGTQTTLYSFGAGGAADGIQPSGGLVQDSKGNLFGTTGGGGEFGLGTIFQLAPDGTVTIVYSFSGNGTDGSRPSSTLLLANDGNFYGTTIVGGANGLGTLYKMDASGNVTTLHSFSASEGASPEGGLIQGNDGALYGNAALGGTYNDGIFFRFSL